MNETTHAGVDTRNRDKWARRATAAVRDVDLRAADVELGTTVRARDVQRDLLDADEVLAARQGLGEREGEARLGCIAIDPIISITGGCHAGRDLQVEGKVSWPLAYVGDCS